MGARGGTWEAWAAAPPHREPAHRTIDESVYGALERRLGTRFEDIFLPASEDVVGLAAAAKRMHAALRANRILYVAGDAKSVGLPVMVPLFGRPVGSPRGWVSLARLAGAAIPRASWRAGVAPARC